MGNLGMTQMLLIAVVVLLLFGAKRLPEIASSMGKGIRDFKKSLNETERAITEVPATANSDRLNRGEQETSSVRSPDTEVRSEPKRLL